MPNIGVHYITCVNGTCHPHEYITSRIMKDSCHLCVTKHKQPETHMNDSCHAGGYGMSHIWTNHVPHVNMVFHSVVQCGAVCCDVLRCVAVCCSVLQCVAVCCSVLQCVSVCCSVLQCVAVWIARSCHTREYAISYIWMHCVTHLSIHHTQWRKYHQ